MNQSPVDQRRDICLPGPHCGLSEQQDNHYCPYCSKAYRTSTWLENHIKTKHTVAATQEQSEMLAHMSNSCHNSVRNALLLSQSLQESRRPALIQELLKQLVPLMERLLPVLEQLGDASLCAPSMASRNLRAPKRCASSPDLRGEREAKLQGLDSSIPEVCTASNQTEPQNYPSGTPSYARISMSSGDPCGILYTGSTTAFSEGSHLNIDSSHYSRRIPRYPYAEQAQGSDGELSYSSTPYLQALNDGIPQRWHRLRSSRTPGPYIQPENTTPMPHELLAGNPLPLLSGEQIPHEHGYSSDWLNSFEPLMGTMQLEPNVQRSYSGEDRHQEMEQNQSIMQGVQQYPSSARQQATEHVLGDCYDRIFHDWNLSPTLDSASTIPVPRLVESMNGGKYHDHESGHSISGKFPANSEPGNC